VGTGDCRLMAIDAATANKIWEATVCEPLQTGITGAPRIAKGKSSWVTTARMMASARSCRPYDAETARKSGVLDRSGRSRKRIRNKRTGDGLENLVWRRLVEDRRRGRWHAITYDDSTGLVIFGTAGADVGYGEMTGVKITGKSSSPVHHRGEGGHRRIRLHFQTGTEGVHSENNQIMMADLPINGESVTWR